MRPVQMKRAGKANRSGLPPGRLKVQDRHFKFRESGDIRPGLGREHPRIIWHQADPRKVPAVVTWLTGRRSAAEPSKSSRAPGHWRAAR